MYNFEVKAHTKEYQVVVGATESKCTGRVVDWALYLCEYSHVMLPFSFEEAEHVPGNNASYRREALDRIEGHMKKNY